MFFLSRALPHSVLHNNNKNNVSLALSHPISKTEHLSVSLASLRFGSWLRFWLAFSRYFGGLSSLLPARALPERESSSHSICVFSKC